MWGLRNKTQTTSSSYYLWKTRKRVTFWPKSFMLGLPWTRAWFAVKCGITHFANRDTRKVNHKKWNTAKRKRTFKNQGMKTREEAEARALELYPIHEEFDVDRLKPLREAYLQGWEDAQQDKQTCGFCVNKKSLHLSPWKNKRQSTFSKTRNYTNSLRSYAIALMTLYKRWFFFYWRCPKRSGNR